LPFETIDRISICSPFAAVNEDAIGATGTAAWVIDGATGVSDLPPLVSGLTDAAWLAAQLNEKLHAAFARAPIDPSAALAEIDAKIQAQFSTINLLQESTASEQPSAALALSVLTDDTVHLIGIGDCRIIVENHGGDVREFDPSKSGPAEARIIQERRRLLAAHPGEDPWPRLKSFIRSMREFANVEGGYSVVHPTRIWNTRVKRQVRNAQEIQHLLAVSDGLYRLVDVFRAINGPEHLLRRALSDGLELLCSELRELELADDRCTVYPRVKTCDDASAVLVRLC
jgi:serine/threonine protein phosphatase PrpC